MTLQSRAPRLILASASASRRALLQAAGLVITVMPAEIDELAMKRDARREGMNVEAAALRLADMKAAWIARANPDALVIGGDQLLVCEGAWFDKPVDLPAARDQLLALRGRTHELVTAVTCHRAGGAQWSHVATPRLSMRRFSDGFLDAYLEAEGDTVTTSVGAYRLEGLGVHLFDRIEGEHAAILGLPMLALLTFLRGKHIITS
jgi:septum formation protein